MNESMRIGRRLTSAAAALSLSGCVFGSVDPQVRQLDAQLQSITRRVDRLESSVGRGPGSASVGTGEAAEAAGESVAVGERTEATGPYTPVFSAAGALGKLGRGVTNLFTGWVEVPKRIAETTTASGRFAGFTWGLLRGAAYGFLRTAAGAYETATFPFPAPPEYRSVIHPTFVFTDEDAG